MFQICRKQENNAKTTVKFSFLIWYYIPEIKDKKDYRRSFENMMTLFCQKLSRKMINFQKKWVSLWNDLPLFLKKKIAIFLSRAFFLRKTSRNYLEMFSSNKEKKDQKYIPIHVDITAWD